MILGTENAAAGRRAADLKDYLDKLDDARRSATALGLLEHAEQLAGLIRSASAAADDTQAVLDAFERQEDERNALRSMRAHARERFDEQLLLIPRPQAFGVL